MVKYIAVYDKNVDFPTLQTELINSGCTVLQVFEKLNTVSFEAPAVNANLASINGILALELETELEVTQQWHLQRITSRFLPMKPLYFPKNYGEGSTAYLIDSGVDTTHPEFVDAAITQLWSWNGSSGDTDGHGTAMASLIVGKTVGVSPKATLKSVKIPFGVTITTSVLLDALNNILTDHLLTPSVKVVNCSWTIPKSSILDSKITELEQQGLVVVAAAGNTNIDANTLSPVGLDSVIGVAQSDAYDRVFSSNWGPDVDITAPGLDISVAALGGTIATTVGTSGAAAIISGIVCQFITDDASLSAAQVQTAVIANATPDVLFRNESVYGTTPNLLAYTLSLGSLFTAPKPENSIVYVKKGTTSNTNITYISPIASINVNNVSTGPSVKTVPDWITLNNDVITANVPETLENGRYAVAIEGLTTDNQQIQVIYLYLYVYTNDVSELDQVETYNYFQQTTGSTPVIVTSACGGRCPETGCVGKNCGCGGSYCASF